MRTARTVPTATSYQLECARQIVSILFKRTSLSTIVQVPALVIVGEGNWISFAACEAVSTEAVLRLSPSGGPAFVVDIFTRCARVRSKTTPSLHLTNLDSGEPLQGHVDAFYWSRNPLRHAGEFLTKRTVTPSVLLDGLR